MLRMEDFRMRRAGAPVGGRLPSSTLRRAKKRLIETYPNSKLGPNNCNHSPLTLSNSNSTCCFPLSSSPNQDSNRQLETIRNRHKPFILNQMTFSNRPKISEVERAPKMPKAKSRQDASGTWSKGNVEGSRRPRFDLLFASRIESIRHLLRLRPVVSKGDLRR
jgi:hypothetical protein